MDSIKNHTRIFIESQKNRINSSSIAVIVLALIFLFSLIQPLPIIAAEQTYHIAIGKQRTARFSLVHDFNQQYQVVGHGNQAFIWEQGGKSVIAPNKYWSEATAINDASYVVGMAAQAEVPGAWLGSAFVWHKDLGIKYLSNSSMRSYARDINNNNLIVGYVQDGTSHLWDLNEGDLLIPGLGGLQTFAMAINDNVDPIVVGGSDQNGMLNAFKWTKTDGTTKLATLDDLPTFAMDVNESGVIVGWIEDVNANPGGLYLSQWDQNMFRYDGGNNFQFSQSPPVFSSHFESTGQAVWWQADGTLNKIPMLAGYTRSIALSINNNGSMVGFVAKTNPPSQLPSRHAFIATADGILDLNDVYPNPDMFYEVATEINDDGVILAWGHSSFFSESSLDLRPVLIVPPNTKAVTNLSAAISINENNYNIGSTITGTASVKNNGPDEAVNLVTRIQIGRGFQIMTVADNCVIENQDIICKQVSLAIDQTNAMSFTLLINEPGHRDLIADVSSDTLEVDKISANASFKIIVNENVQNRQYSIIRINQDVYDLDPASYPYSQAYDVNDAGKIVGRIGCRGFVWDAGVTTLRPFTLPIITDPCSTSPWSETSSINNNNFMSGIEGSQAFSNAFVNDDGTSKKFDLPQSYLRKINSNGLTAGYSQKLGEFSSAFVWDSTLDIALPMEDRITR